MITFLKVLLTIILIPLKIVFFVFAYIFKLISYIMYFFLILLGIPFAFIGSIITPIFSLASIVLTIYEINQIRAGATPLSEGVFLIVGVWITTGLLTLFTFAIETLADGILSLGDILVDWANANWFEFW